MFASMLKGSRFGRLDFCKVEGFEVSARVSDSRSKGSRFRRLGSF